MAVDADGRKMVLLPVSLSLACFPQRLRGQGDGAPRLSLSPVCPLCIKQRLEHSGHSINILHVNECMQELLPRQRTQNREREQSYIHSPLLLRAKCLQRPVGRGEGGGPGRWDKTGGCALVLGDSACSGHSWRLPQPPSSPGFCRNHRGPLREPRLRSGLTHHRASEARSPGTADRAFEAAARVTCSGFVCPEGFFVQQDGRCGLLPPGNQTSTLMF